MAEIGFDIKSWISEKPQVGILNYSIYDPWKLRIKSAEEFSDLKSVDKLIYLAWLGSLAPSTHNTIPEKFNLNSEVSSLGIFLDRRRVLPFSDPTGRQACVSLGCVMGNIEVAAQAYGLGISKGILSGLKQDYARYQPNYSELIVPVSNIQLKDETATSVDTSLLQAILSRKMLRTRYDVAVALPPNLASTLKSIAGQDNLGFHLITDSPRKAGLAKFQERADSFVFNNQDFSYELGEYLLPNSENSLPYAMRGREFNLTDEYALTIHQGLRHLAKLSASDIGDFSRASGDGIRKASAIAVITVTEDTPYQWLRAGVAYEKMALALRQEEFYTAMHAGITEVESVNWGFRLFLGDPRRRPTVVFRIGKPVDPKDLEIPHSARPSINQLVI